MIRTPGLDRVQTPHAQAEDELDATLRPQRLEEFVGQDQLKEQLAVSIAAATARSAEGGTWRTVPVASV